MQQGLTKSQRGPIKGQNGQATELSNKEVPEEAVHTVAHFAEELGNISGEKEPCSPEGQDMEEDQGSDVMAFSDWASEQLLGPNSGSHVCCDLAVTMKESMIIMIITSVNQSIST